MLLRIKRNDKRNERKELGKKEKETVLAPSKGPLFTKKEKKNKDQRPPQPTRFRIIQPQSPPIKYSPRSTTSSALLPRHNLERTIPLPTRILDRLLLLQHLVPAPARGNGTCPRCRRVDGRPERFALLEEFFGKVLAVEG
jgi:hypothetical protein